MKNMGKYFTNNMSCIYLDQFAVSNISNESKNEDWEQISSLIRKGVKLRKIICPISYEHLIETSGRPLSKATKQDKDFRELSFGWSFYPEVNITAWQIICKIRNVRPTKHHFIEKTKKKQINEKGIYAQTKQIRQTFDEMVADGSESSNTIRKVARNGVKGDKELRDKLVKIIKQKQSTQLIQRFTKLEEHGSYNSQPIKLGGQSIPHWADILCHFLTRKHRLNKQEAAKIKTILEVEGVESIPAINIRFSLEAMLAYKQTIETANDQIDIMRISGALPFVDIMITDGPRAYDIKELGLSKKYETDIFSEKKEDLNRLILQLQNIIDS